MIATRVTKLAVAGVAAAVLTGGAAFALVGRSSDPAPKRTAAKPAQSVLNRGVQAGPSADGLVRVGVAGEQPTASGTVSAKSASPTATGGSASISGGGAQASSGVSTGLLATGTGGTGAQAAVGGGLSTPATGGPSGTSAGGQVTTPPAGPAGGSGGTGGSGGNGGNLTPPTVPSDVSLHRDGTYTVTVPGTSVPDKELCLKGEINRCRVVKVPAVGGVSMTVSYTGNTSTTAPTHSVFRCKGGLGVTVSGITSGTTVTVRVEDVAVSGTLTATEVSQSVSLCDA